jgi:hypothetical protein
LSGFRLLGLSPLPVRRSGYYFGLHATFSGFDRMVNKAERGSPPIAYARKNADGFWYVAVTWGNGRQERLGPYKTEAAAQELVKAQLAAWHEGRKLFLKPPQ